jgi:PKD repeat protein
MIIITVATTAIAEESEEVELIIIDGPPEPPIDISDRIITFNPESTSTTSVQLSNVPTSKWTQGCSATSAGMIFGYYDRIGYPSMYNGPANGGICPLSELGQGSPGDSGYPFTGSCSIIATAQGFDGRTTRGHTDDYWISYTTPGPDPWVTNGWTEHTWSDCTADYMGTNQWKWDYNPPVGIDFNTDGSTCLWTLSSNAKLYDYIPPAVHGLPQTSLAHGMRLFVESRGYNVEFSGGNYQVYTQKTDNVISGGFSFNDFKNEIDNGYPVMVQVEGHSMVGMGYDDSTSPPTIFIHDTWGNYVSSMPWGGSYSGMNLIAITVIHLVPVNNPPVADANGPYVVNENTPVNFNGASSSDPDGDPLQYRWDFNNDGIYDTAWSSSPYESYTWCDDYVGTAKLQVSDGILTDTDTSGVTVNNVAPTVSVGPDATIFVGQTYIGSGSFTDPGCDTWTATVDYGDGTGVQPLSLIGKTFSLSHTYLLIGDFTVTVTVCDDDAGCHSDTLIVHVLCIPEVWVDDDAPPSWYDYAHLNSIDVAAYRVCPAGTVYVYDGQYIEDVTVLIQKNDILIIGEDLPIDPDTRATLDGTITINADGVRIENMWFNCSVDPVITVYSINVVLLHNVFYRCCDPLNTGVSADFPVDAEYNWWGAPNGPNGGIMDDGSTADGYGVQVIGPVYVEPWVGVHAVASAIPDTIEAGNPIVFDAQGSWAADFYGMYEPEYLWFKDDRSQYSDEKQFGHVYVSPGIYNPYLRVKGNGIFNLYNNFMFDWDYLTITIVPAPETLYAVADPNHLGEYETITHIPVQLYGDAIGGTPPYTYEWNLNDGMTSNEQNPQVTYDSIDIYAVTLTVTDSTGGTATDTAYVNVLSDDSIIVNIIGPETGIVNSDVIFDVSVIGGHEPYNYLWDFGDGKTSNIAHPTHTF